MRQQLPSASWPLRLSRLLLLLQGLLNVALPCVAYAYYLNYVDSSTFHPFVISGMNYFFLVIVFVFFMQLASLQHQPSQWQELLVGLLSPFIYLGVASVFSELNVLGYTFELAAVYTTALIVALLATVFVRPFTRRRVFRWSGEQARFYVIAAAAQLVFLLPGLLAIWVFGRVIVAERIGTGSSGDWLELALITMSGVQLSLHEYRWMRQEAVLP